MNSYSALGPSLRVMRLVNSFEMGFSMNHDSCLNSLFTMLSLVFPLGLADYGLFFDSGDPSVLSRVKGKSETSNFSVIFFLL
jgi:hypothetical protein